MKDLSDYVEEYSFNSFTYLLLQPVIFLGWLLFCILEGSRQPYPKNQTKNKS